MQEKQTHKLSSSVRLEVGGLIFASVMCVMICVGVHLMYRSYGYTEAYLRPGVIKTALVLGAVTAWQTFRIWKRYK